MSVANALIANRHPQLINQDLLDGMYEQHIFHAIITLQYLRQSDLVNLLWILLIELKEDGIVRQTRNPRHLYYLRESELEGRRNQGIDEDTGSTDFCPFD